MSPTGAAPTAPRVHGVWRVVAVGLAVVVVSAGAVLTVRSANDDDAPDATDGAHAALAPPEISVELPMAGMVVTLRRPGTADVPTPVGSTSTFSVTVDALEPIGAVELWAGDEVVDRVVPTPDRRGRTDALSYVATGPGHVTLVARAADVDGRWGQSNPVQLEVVDRAPPVGITTVVVDAPETVEAVAARTDSDPDVVRALNDVDPGAAGEALPTGSELRVPTAIPAFPADIDSDARELPPLPEDLDTATAPELAVDLGGDGCSAQLSVTAERSYDDLVVVEVSPSSRAFVPVADLGSIDDATTVTETVPLVAGSHTYVVVGGLDGRSAGWSAPVQVTGNESCDQWTGEVRLRGGELVLADGSVPPVQRAYVYLESEADRWRRVPEVGFVDAGVGGFDFTPHLPPVAGRDIRIEAWGHGAGGLASLGRGQLSVAQGTRPESILGSPSVRLDRLEHPDEGSSADGLPEHVRLGWSTSIPGVTHVVWQVSRSPIPVGSGPDPGGVLLQGSVRVDRRTFDVPLGEVVAVASSAGLDAATSPVLDTISLDGAATYTAWLDTDSEPMRESSTPPQFHSRSPDGAYTIRLVPFAGDTYLGVESNDVRVAPEKAPDWPQAPLGTPDHRLEMELLDEPRPPNPMFGGCWQIAGFVDEAAWNFNLSLEKFLSTQDVFTPNVYRVWDLIRSAMGDDPICVGCYHWGSSKVGIGGAKCSTSSFFGDLFKAFGAMVNALANGFAYLKSIIVDAVATLSGCKAVAGAAAGSSGESICNTLATVAVNSVLMSMGIPPTLPNFDQLVAAAKGEIVELAVALAAQAGVPCDDADFAAEVHGDAGLTCAGAVEALLDEVSTQISAAYTDMANSMGFGFPPELRVVPHPDGQVHPATIRLSVHPTRYSAAVDGTACGASVLTGSTWKPVNNASAVFAHGLTPIVGTTWIRGLYPDPWCRGTCGRSTECPRRRGRVGPSTLRSWRSRTCHRIRQAPRGRTWPRRARTRSIRRSCTTRWRSCRRMSPSREEPPAITAPSLSRVTPCCSTTAPNSRSRSSAGARDR